MKKIFFIFFIAILCCKMMFCQNNEFSCVQGVDLSYLQQLESLDVKYFDENNIQINDMLVFFKSKGMDCIRLRLWVNPEYENNSWCNLENTVKMAKRIKEARLKFLLDIHYSDSWADPSNQKIPKAWEQEFSPLSINKLSSLVTDYTEKVLTSLIAEDIYPDYIQIGNEITNGMLFPYGKITSSGTDLQKFSSLALLLNSGINKTRQLCPQTKIILHIDCGSDIEKSQWWFTCIKNAKIDYDIIGLSYYSLWQSKNLDVLSSNISNLINKFKKPVFIVETAYPWTLKWNDNINNLYGQENQLIKGFPATKEGQKAYYKKIYEILMSKKTLLQRQKLDSCGLFWWEPESIPSANKEYQSSIENLAWFDFQNTYFGTGMIE